MDTDLSKLQALKDQVADVEAAIQKKKLLEQQAAAFTHPIKQGGPSLAQLRKFRKKGIDSPDGNLGDSYYPWSSFPPPGEPQTANKVSATLRPQAGSVRDAYFQSINAEPSESYLYTDLTVDSFIEANPGNEQLPWVRYLGFPNATGNPPCLDEFWVVKDVPFYMNVGDLNINISAAAGKVRDGNTLYPFVELVNGTVEIVRASEWEHNGLTESLSIYLDSTAYGHEHASDPRYVISKDDWWTSKVHEKTTIFSEVPITDNLEKWIDEHVDPSTADEMNLERIDNNSLFWTRTNIDYDNDPGNFEHVLTYTKEWSIHTKYMGWQGNMAEPIPNFLDRPWTTPLFFGMAPGSSSVDMPDSPPIILFERMNLNFNNPPVGTVKDLDFTYGNSKPGLMSPSTTFYVAHRADVSTGRRPLSYYTPWDGAQWDHGFNPSNPGPPSKPVWVAGAPPASSAWYNYLWFTFPVQSQIIRLKMMMQVWWIDAETWFDVFDYWPNVGVTWTNPKMEGLVFNGVIDTQSFPPLPSTYFPPIPQQKLQIRSSRRGKRPSDRVIVPNPRQSAYPYVDHFEITDSFLSKPAWERKKILDGRRSRDMLRLYPHMRLPATTHQPLAPVAPTGTKRSNPCNNSDVVERKRTAIRFRVNESETGDFTIEEQLSETDEIPKL